MRRRAIQWSAEDVVAWEPPAAGVVPGGPEISASIMEPVEAHLADHPGDFVGAQAILLSAVLGFPVSADDPAFATARSNAEPFVRDEPAITTTLLDPAALAGTDLTVALGSAPNELVAAAGEILSEASGRPAVGVEADHEVYLSDPSVLTDVITSPA